MAQVRWYLNATLLDGWALVDQTAATAATIPGGWVVGTGATFSSEFTSGATDRAATTFVANTVPDGTLDTTLKDAFRSQFAWTGSFAAGNWTFQFAVVSTVQSGLADGQIVFRVLKADADGANATQITTAQQSTTIATNVAGTDVNITATWAAPAWTITNQYIFVQVAWKRTGAGGMTTTNIRLRTGSSTTVGTTGLTADFTPTLLGASIASTASLPTTVLIANQASGGDATSGIAAAGSRGPGQIISGHTATVTQVYLELSRTGEPAGSVYVQIRSGSWEGTIVGTSESVECLAVPTLRTNIIFTFPSGVALTGGTYYLECRRDAPLDDAVGIAFSLWISVSGTYPGGDMVSPSGTVLVPGWDAGFALFSGSSHTVALADKTIGGATIASTVTILTDHVLMFVTATGTSVLNVDAPSPVTQSLSGHGFVLNDVMLEMAVVGTPTDGVYLELRDGTGTLIAYCTPWPGNSFLSSFAYKDFAFLKPVILNAGATYSLNVVPTRTVTDAVNYYTLRYSASNPYAGGMLAGQATWDLNCRLNGGGLAVIVTPVPQGVTGVTLGVGSGVNTPTVERVGAALDQAVDGQTLVSTAQANEPSLTVGAVAVSGATLAVTSQTLGVAVATGAVGVSGVTCASALFLNLPTVVPGPVTVSGAMQVATSQTFSVAVATGAVGLSGVTCASTLFINLPTVVTGPVAVSGATLASATVLRLPTVSWTQIPVGTTIGSGSVANAPVALTLNVACQAIYSTARFPYIEELQYENTITSPAGVGMSAAGRNYSQTISGFAGTLTAVSLSMAVSNPPNTARDAFYLEIREGTFNGPLRGTSLRVAGTDMPRPLIGWVKFDFPGGVVLSAGTTYWIETYTTRTVGGGGSFVASYSTTNRYTGGGLYDPSGNVFGATNDFLLRLYFGAGVLDVEQPELRQAITTADALLPTAVTAAPALAHGGVDQALTGPTCASTLSAPEPSLSYTIGGAFTSSSLADSYPDLSNLGLANPWVGQSFIGNGNPLTGMRFLLSPTNSTGTISAELYASTGTYGSSAAPVGAPLALSSPRSPVSGSRIWHEFVFTGVNQVTLTSGTVYIAVIHGKVDASVPVRMQNVVQSVATHQGNACYSSNGSSWTVQPTSDVCLQVLTERVYQPTVLLTDALVVPTIASTLQLFSPSTPLLIGAQPVYSTARFFYDDTLLVNNTPYANFATLLSGDTSQTISGHIGTVWAASFYVRKATSGAYPPIYLDVRQSTYTGPLLATSVADPNTITTSFDWVKFELPAGVVLNAGTTYWLTLRLSSAAPDNYRFGLSDSNNYGGGQVYTNGSPQISNWDFLFRLHSGAGVVTVGQVIAPAIASASQVFALSVGGVQAVVQQQMVTII